MATNEPVASTFQALARAAVAQAWTGFECVAADSWVAALNADTRFGQSAFVAPAPTDMPDGLTNKSISIALLGKFRFDLRRCMGTVLRDKFHFGKVDGVTSVGVELANGTVTVESEHPVDPAAVSAAVAEAGYEVAPT